jgi:hypothetical protein
MSEAERSHNIEFLAATHIGRLFEQREMLTEVLDTMQAEHAKTWEEAEEVSRFLERTSWR